jgi:hypothetical protein
MPVAGANERKGSTSQSAVGEEAASDESVPASLSGDTGVAGDGAAGWA